MRGDLINGFVTLAGTFPPSLNVEEDPTRLKPFESPEVYGVDPKKDGRIKTATIPAGTARTNTQYTFGGYTWDWYYNRVWRFSGSTLYYGAPEYTDVFLRQGHGELNADATIITILPCLGNAMCVVTATGSYLIRDANDSRGFFELSRFSQEMYATGATYCNVLNDNVFVCNDRGVFSWDGNNVKEWTRGVRNTLGSFASKAITCDYQKGFIVGAASFVIDTMTGKLFDFGTSGFRFTTRTMAQGVGMNPFETLAVGFLIEHGTEADGTISWQTKIEDNDWVDQPDIECKQTSGQHSRIEREIKGIRTGHKFALRVTSLSSNIYIKSIEAAVRGLAQNSFAE